MSAAPQTHSENPDAWRERLLDTPAQLRALLERTHRIAVLGVKTPESGQPAYYVPDHAYRAGYDGFRCPSTIRRCVSCSEIRCTVR